MKSVVFSISGDGFGGMKLGKLIFDFSWFF